MADINVILPKADETKSVETLIATPTTITSEMTIVDALENKNNSLVIAVMAATDGTLTIKAGDHYPNRILGDLNVKCTADAVTVIRLQDISRFETKLNKVNLAVTEDAEGDTLTGAIIATAKRAGIMSVADQNAEDNRG
jgi:hypothetical protein